MDVWARVVAEVAELPDDSRFGIRAGGPEVGHRQGLFEGEAARDDLPEEARHVVVRQRSGVLRAHALEDLGFPFRPVEDGRLVAEIRGLDLRHALRAGGAFVQEPREVLVDLVYALPDAAELVLHGSGHPFPVTLALFAPPATRPRL